MASSQLTDFSDRLSPMLIKELRQGLRTSLFTSSFILLQVFMVFTVFIGAASGGDTAAVSGFFWFFLIVALVVIMPIRGFNALSSELQLNTMDLLQLTKLSAWRITLGKWTALMSQTSLLVISILPYLVMRYFFGGVDLIQEFIALFFAFLASALLTALAVGFSAFRSVLLRSAVLAVTVIFSMSTLIPLSYTYGRGGGPLGGGVTSSDFWWALAGIVFIAIYCIYFVLDLGASQIAPIAENHATRKRLIAVVFTLSLSLINYFFIEQDWIYIFVILAMALAWLDALTERPATLPSVMHPFQKNFFLSWSKYLLAPGWHTGILFFIITAPLLAIPLYLTVSSLHLSSELKNLVLLLSLLGAVTYPLIFIHLFVPNSKQMFGLYVLLQCCTLVITSIIAAASGAISKIGDILYYCLPIPTVTLMAIEDSSSIRNHSLYFLFTSIFFLTISLIIPLWRARPLYKQMRNGGHSIDPKTEFEANRLL